MKKLQLTILFCIISLTTFAQLKPHNNCNPACYTLNPPWWCDCNPVSLDDYMFVLMLIGILLGIWYYQFNNVKKQQKI